MKTSLLFILSSLSVILLAQPSEKNKSGFGFGALPAVSYDSDLGFQYGAIINLYDYGNGTIYPKYKHSLYLEYSRYTKGSSISRAMYDSEKLIPNIRMTIDVSYLTDRMMDFYGFNGYQSNYDKNIADDTRYFYKNDRNMFRAKVDFQGNFGDSNFGWVAGYSFYHFDMDTVNINKLELEYIEGGALYQRYIKYGLIDEKEVLGGSVNYLKIGVKYDSRNQRANPTKGIWTEAVIQSAPDFFNSFPHTKFALIHRQYFSLLENLSFAYRIDYQMSVGRKNTPYFAQPLLITSFLTAATNQGMGGKNSVRGILRNRVVGDNIGFGNFEFRYKFLKFDWLNQHFYLGTNLFFDTGIVLKPINIDKQLTALTEEQKTELHLDEYKSGKFHSTAGAGLKVGWNENFVISVDVGKAFNKQDGNLGFYVGLNYLF